MAAAYKSYGNYGEAMDQSGGFFNSPTQGASPAGGRKPGVSKAQNVVPMSISQIMKCASGDIVVENQQVAILVLLGNVKDVQHHPGRTHFNLDDKSGIMEVTHFHDDEKQESNLEDGSLVRVVGHFKEFNSKKSIIAISIRVCESLNELTCHLLEVLYTPLKLRQIQTKQLDKSGVSQLATGALPNSMIAQNAGIDAGSSVAGFRPNEQRVYMIIRNCNDEMGIHKDDIIKQCQGVMNQREIESVLDMMTTEGHIFSTVNDDTFKSTEA